MNNKYVELELNKDIKISYFNHFVIVQTYFVESKNGNYAKNIEFNTEAKVFIVDDKSFNTFDEAKEFIIEKIGGLDV